MRIKQLEKLFQEYKKTHTQQVSENGESAVLYTKEDFHINKKQQTVYISNVGVIQINEINADLEQPDWIGFCVSGQNARIVMGTGNPYRDEYLDVLPVDNGMIVAIPNSLRVKFLKGK
jgi:hypothetical protein